MKTHGMTKTPEYSIWVQMRRRCRDPKMASYSRYGARGITVSDEWDDSFEVFYSDMGPRPDANYSIDRIDGFKGYSKENCRWATHEEQNNNRSSNVLLNHLGKTLSVAEWAREIGVSRMTLHSRIKRGLSVEKILSPAIQKQNTVVEIEGVSKSFSEWADETRLSEACLRRRWNLGERGRVLLEPSRLGQPITINGVTKTLRQWAIQSGIPYHTAYQRFRQGMPIEDVLFVGNLKRKKSHV